MASDVLIGDVRSCCDFVYLVFEVDERKPMRVLYVVIGVFDRSDMILNEVFRVHKNDVRHDELLCRMSRS